MTGEPIPVELAEGDALAMDFALGALDRETTRAAQLRLARDPAFRAEVEDWQARLSPLLDEVDAVVPPAVVWEYVADDIAVAAPVRAAERSGSLWASIGLWRGLALSSTALAAIAAVMLVARPGPPPVPQLLVATLASETGQPMLTATYDAGRAAVILAPAGKNDAAGRTPELWVIEGDNPPRSLGVIDIDSPERHAIPAERLKGLRPGSTLAISLEPAGGSPTGAPTGPVVATGKLTGI